MTEITSLYVHKVLAHAGSDVPVHDLLEPLGMAPGDPVDPYFMVSSLAYYDFFAALVERDPDGLTLPLRIGASMRSDDYGAFGLAWKSAPTLRGSYQRSERYGQVLGSAEAYTLEPTGNGTFFTLKKSGDGRTGMLLSNEASMAAVSVISREVTTANFVPTSVHFKHTARGDTAVYEAHFGCSVCFETGRDALLIEDQYLDAPNRLGDQTIAQFFDAHLEKELAASAQKVGLEHQLGGVVASALSEGVPTLTRVASELGMSGRTLQRRLSREGVSFQNVVDGTRRELARKLLRDTDYSLAEVSFLCGFSEQSAFTRAFRRWEAKTPRDYRMAAR
ncbi:MAG: AraC family transcriptional regulator ligand-binding domain-containing protein [Pseudomonadota bacterium]